jgi:fumarate reductase iron-sulfur subunit
MNDVATPTTAAPSSETVAMEHPNDVAAPSRTLTIRVMRHDPSNPTSEPHLQTYELEEADGMTLFIALSEIREKLDASLRFDFVCRAGICGSCAMVINGRPTLACRTLTKSLPAEITLAPLPFFELIGDLSIDTGKWMREMSERVQGWLHMRDGDPDLRRIEERMDPDLAEKIYELDRCIECGCCVAGCGTARMREDFIGAVGLNRVARFRLDPRDTRADADYYDVVGDDDGIFGCMSLLGCQDVCPKSLPLQTQLAYLRRAMMKQGLAKSDPANRRVIDIARVPEQRSAVDTVTATATQRTET